MGKTRFLRPCFLLTFALCVAFGAPTLVAQPDFLRGDCNQDGVIDIADAVNVWRIRFAGAPQPCIAACEADGNGIFNGLVDGLYLFFYVIDGGSPPPAPFPDCGPDPSPTPRRIPITKACQSNHSWG